MRSTRSTSCGTTLLELALELEDLKARREVVELRRVDRDRVTRCEQPAAVVLRRRVDEVALRLDDVLAGAEKVATPALGVETDHVVGEQAVMERDANRGRQDPPVVRLRPGDVHEVRERRLRTARADEARRQVEVVVVKADSRIRLRFELRDDRVGEVGVDGDVALLPRKMQSPVEIGRVREVPQVVLEKPERRVRDDVVEPVVRGLIVSDEPQAIRRPVVSRLRDRLAAGLRRNRAVLVGHCARNPRHVVHRDQASERGDEPAATAARDPIAFLVQPECRGRTVGHDDQLPTGAHGP